MVACFASCGVWSVPDFHSFFSGFGRTVGLNVEVVETGIPDDTNVITATETLR